MNNRLSSLDVFFALLSTALLVLTLYAEFVLIPDFEISGSAQFFIEVFKVGFSLSVAWFTQKILSRYEYVKNLRERAVSSYRRIKDLKSSISMLGTDVHSINLEGSSFGTIVKLISLTADSAVADWADIIGDEILIDSKLDELKKEEARLSSLQELSENYQRELVQVRDQISELKGQISASLFVPTQVDDSLPRAGRYVRVVANAIEVLAHRNKAFLIELITYEGQEPVLFEDIKNNGPFRITITQPGMSKYYVEVVDSYGVVLGEVANPYQHEGLYYLDFVVTLFEVMEQIGIDVIDGPRQETYVAIEGIQVIESPLGDGRACFRIPIDR